MADRPSDAYFGVIERQAKHVALHEGHRSLGVLSNDIDDDEDNRSDNIVSRRLPFRHLFSKSAYFLAFPLKPLTASHKI